MIKTLKQVGMMLVECVLYFGLAMMSYGAIGGLMVRLGLVDMGLFVDGPDLSDPIPALLAYIPMFGASILATVAVHRFIFKRSYSFSGFTTYHLIKDFGIGALIALLMLAIGFVSLYICGYISIEKISFSSYLFFGFMLLFFVQSSFEEFVMRSFLLPSVATRSNIYWGLAVSSVIFAVLHGGNDHLSMIPMINLLLAGVFMGVLFLAYKSVWSAVGFHFAWNFLQGSFFGFEVSGIDVYSYIDSSEVGPDVWTGGSFGYEGSMIATILLITGTYWVWAKHKDIFAQPTYEWRGSRDIDWTSNEVS